MSPIFEYKCDKCGKVSEFLEGMMKKEAKSCPKCGSDKMTKQLSTFAPRVKEGESKRCRSCSDGSCPHAGH